MLPSSTLLDAILEHDPAWPPGWIRDAGDRLPARSRTDRKTTGHLYGADGKPLNSVEDKLTMSDGRLRSGEVDVARSGIRPDWYPTAQVTREHVEAHAAAILRRPRSPNEAVVVVNKETCTSRLDYVGCDEVLPGLLPRGKRLAVYVKEGGSTTLFKVYRGTGEGIADVGGVEGR